MARLFRSTRFVARAATVVGVLGLLSVCAIAGASPYTDVVSADDPLIYWRLGEDATTKSSSGTAVNSAVTGSGLGTSGNGTYKFAVGNVTDSPLVGDTDTAAHFGTTAASGSTGDQVILNPFPATKFPATELSAEMWIRAAVPSTESTVLSYESGLSGGGNNFLWIKQGTNFNPYLANNTQPGLPIASVYNSQWNHVVLTWRSSDGQLNWYLNGKLAKASTLSQGVTLKQGGSLVLAQEQDGPGGGFSDVQKFIGDLDEVALYGRVLSPGQIAKHYATAVTGVIPPPADVAVYHFDEGQNNVAHDSTIFEHHGTLAGGTTWGSGVNSVFGSAVHFDGINGRMQAPLPASNMPTQALTVEGWFYVDQNPDSDNGGPVNNWRWIFSNGGWGYAFASILEQDRRFGFDVMVGGTMYRWWSGQKLPLDEWAHVAWTYDAATGMMRTYLNGAELSHYIGTTGPLDTTNNDFFLSWNSGSANPIGNGAFPGFMDEVAIYSRMLTANEIRARFLGGPPDAYTPEPSTFVLSGLGLLGLALMGLRRRKRPA